MTSRTLRRGLPAVLFAVFALLMASPASASVSHSGAITGGTVNIDTKGPDFAIDLGESDADDPCPDDPADDTIITANFNPDGTTAVTGIAASVENKVGSRFQDSNGTWYQLVLTLGTGSQAGSITGASSPYTINQNVSLRGTITTINPLTCVKGATLCVVQLNMVLSGTFTSTPPNTLPHPPGVANVSGGGTIQRGVPCNAPASGWFAPTPPPAPSVTVTGLTINFV